MKESTSEDEEVADQITEYISKLIQIPLGEGATKYNIYDSSLYEGDAVVVYVFRPASEVMFQVGYVVCGSEGHRFLEVYTLGVRELLVEGRVGWCSDGARQSSWQVLLDPEVLAVSAAATKSVRLIPDGGSTDVNVASSVEDRETCVESSVNVSRDEALRRVEQSDGGRRVFNRVQATTQAMEETNDVWAFEYRPAFVRALQARVAAHDGDFPMPSAGSGGQSA